jgi:DNA-binding NarL/FixJ family response regulator
VDIAPKEVWVGQRTNDKSSVGILIVRNKTPLFTDVLEKALWGEPSVRLLSGPLGLESALEFCRHNQPDVVLIEATQEAPTGVLGSVSSIVGACGGAPAVLVVDQVIDDQLFVAGVEAGAFAILDGSAGVEEVIRAVHTAAARERTIDVDRLTKAVQAVARSREVERHRFDRMALLTPREREVLGCLLEGLRNSEIAKRLDISYRTVEKHVQHILRKLAVSSRLGAVALASEVVEIRQDGMGETA